MIIKFISNKPHPEFEILEDNNILIHIKIDAETQGFRIKFEDKRRVFFISDEIIKKNKIKTLLNEYSQQLGSLTEDKINYNQGEIEIEDRVYLYKLNDDFLKEINLFEQHSGELVLNCKLGNGELSFLKKSYLNYILFSLAWFAFLTKEKTGLSKLAKA
jgi:hypothetical protein